MTSCPKTNQHTSRYYQPFFRRNPYQEQTHCNGQKAVELCVFPHPLHDMPQEETRSHNGKEEYEIINPEFPGEVMGPPSKKRQVKSNRQHYIRSDAIKQHQLYQMADMDAVFTGNRTFGFLRNNGSRIFFSAVCG